MKKILLSLIIITLTPLSALAQEKFEDIDVLQGETIEIKIPKHELQNVECFFEGEYIKFYEVTNFPNFDEPISRGEFLKLMFLNHDFGEIPSTTATNFPDVPKDNPYYQDVQKAATLGIVNGYDDGLFRPYTTITRGQVAKVLIEAFKPTTELKDSPEFSDVPPTHIFYNHIEKAIKAEYFKGYPDGLMRPDREINFEEAQIVIKRASNQKIYFELGEREYFRAFIGIHRNSDTVKKPLKLTITNKDGNIEERTININVHYRDVPIVRFNLPEDKDKLFNQEDQDKTWAMINEAKAHPLPEKLWKETFIIPTIGKLTLGFGDKLYINGRYAGSHFGHDYANIEGTEIWASNSGIITLSDYTPSFGNTIVIDHGQNVFTMYLHMSELIATKGQKVKKGDIIGLMGTTGISTGSHLHFTQFIGNTIVNSEQWIKEGF